MPTGVLLSTQEAVPPDSAPVVHAFVPSDMETVPLGVPAAPPLGTTDTATV